MDSMFGDRKKIISDCTKGKAKIDASDKFPYLRQSDFSVPNYFKAWDELFSRQIFRKDYWGKYHLICNFRYWKTALWLKLYDWDLDIAFHREENIDRWVLTNDKEFIVSEGA